MKAVHFLRNAADIFTQHPGYGHVSHALPDVTVSIVLDSKGKT